MNIAKDFHIASRNMYLSDLDFVKMSESEFADAYDAMSGIEKMSYDARAFHNSLLPSRYSYLLPKEIREHNARCVKAHLDYFGL